MSDIVFEIFFQLLHFDKSLNEYYFKTLYVNTYI